MPYSTVILNNLDVTLSDLAKYSMTRNVERFLCEAELLVASMALYCNVVLLPIAILLHLPASLRSAQPCKYCFYSVVEKQLFRPARKFDTGPLPNFTFIEAEMWEYSPQNCQNFEFWP